MATVVLSAVGSAVGGAAGGSVLGVSSVAIGQAAGAIAGSFIDQKLLGSGSVAVETGRAKSLRVQSSTEGTAIPQVFGRMRVAGQIIWSTRYREIATTRREQGSKNNPGRTITDYSYTISVAVGLCQGPIQRIGRVWADGQLLRLSGINHRIYNGTETQLPDPKIEAVEGYGRVPAYRGLAYVVFEDFPVEDYGNHIPQFNFEVFRSAQSDLDTEETGKPVPELVQAVTMSPGTGEFALDPLPARLVYPAGGGTYMNINNSSAKTDIVAALDQMDAELPKCKATSLIVSWFGNDLRCGLCRVEPRIEERDRVNSPSPWRSTGLSTATANVVSRDSDDRVNFGGTPDDGSIIRAIQNLKARGQSVTLYPFLLMDIAAENGLPDPYGKTEQAAFPWRGRITLDIAPGMAGSTDKTAAAALEVAEFFGTAAASDFQSDSGVITYSGPDEWTWRRFVLHLAMLGAAAGGVDGICIGTELRGLTTIRSGISSFPAVDELVALAAEVRSILPNAKITYAADWSEYFGHHPSDGSGDVHFHLDPLWADANIDAVGIDDYTPLSDWRYGSRHADADAKSVYDLDYLKSQVEGGEYYHYYYADQNGRLAQERLPISDGTYGEDWVFRAKDIRNWWANPHHNRIGGVRQSQPTAWVPRSKPIWLTETGCPATDLGANQPNLFVDDKSSESALPTGSRGARDDEMQRRFIQAKLGYWQDVSKNPISPVYGGRMIPSDRVFVWTWDARPWPDFPVRQSIWADGPSHRLGHWITGRVTAGSLAEVIAEICKRSGLALGDFDVSQVYGVVDGYLLETTQSAREALQPLLQVHGVDVFESGGRIVFANRGIGNSTEINEELLVASPETTAGPVSYEVGRETELTDQIRLTYSQAENDYRMGAVETRLPDGNLLRVSESSLPLALPGSKAQQIVDRWLAESNRANTTCAFNLPPSAIALEPGDLVSMPGPGGDDSFRIERITETASREVDATRTEPSLYVPTAAPERDLEPALTNPFGPMAVEIMDLPIADGSESDHQPWIAVSAEPWPGSVSVLKSATGSNFSRALTLRSPASMGQSLQDLEPAEANRWQRGDWVVLMPSGSMTSANRIDVLNGENALAIQHPNGWEILQFELAELIDNDTYRVSNLLRGQRGTDFLSKQTLTAGARVVLLDAAVQPLPLSGSECNLARTWRVGPATLEISHPSYVQIQYLSDCAGLRPFAPAHLRLKRDGNDIDLTWVRTSRVGADNLEAFEVPQAEAEERYRVTIRSNSNLLRTAEVTVPAYRYLTSDQFEDGASGTIEFTVQQFSTAVGYGTERTMEINV
ncbi:MAG: glycoside hydrolase/phage tail family protein [Pseudomonadota bacterium]